MKRRTLPLLALTPLALLAAGCSSNDSSATNRPAASQPVTSLVAADPLGHALFTDTTTTASSQRTPRPSFAEVPSR